MREERFTGCLLGLAVGDALGAPLEFMGRERIRQIHGRVTEMIGGGWLRLRPGEYTDDTDMMLCVAQGIADKGRFDADETLRCFVRWLNTDPKDIGITTRSTLIRVRDGMPWAEASQRTHRELRGRTASNGALMRCAPIALLDVQDEQALIRDSLLSSRLTHWHDVAAWSCAALNLSIADLMHGVPKEELVEHLLPRIDHEVVRQAVERVPHMSIGAVRASGYAVDCLQAALWAFLRTESFEAALVAVVNLGEDTDTAGAVCGALAGAAYGYDAIPSRWREALRGPRQSDGDKIVSLARRIYEIVSQPLP